MITLGYVGAINELRTHRSNRAIYFVLSNFFVLIAIDRVWRNFGQSDMEIYIEYFILQ